MGIQKLSDESIKEYKIRLCRNKSEYGITFDDIANLVNRETGETKSESYFRRWWNGYNEGYEDGLSESYDDVLDNKIFELERKKIEYNDYRNAFKKQVRDNTRKNILYDIILDEIKNIKPYSTLNEVSNIITHNNNDVIVCLNDIHYGIEIENHWNKYNSDIAKLRLEKYLNRIFNIRNTHDSENCYVMANGDLISGNIHPTIQISNKENVVQQVIGVSELISWFLYELSTKFNNIYFSVVSGNHSRLSNKDNSPKDERLDLLIPWYIKARLQNNKNIIILDNDIDTTLNVVTIRGLNYLNVHGDYDNFSNIQRLVEMLDKEIYCIHFGHLHHNATDHYQKYKLIMSGSLQGMDDYCIQKRIYGNAEQLVCICDNNGILCTYDVDLQ